MKPERMEINMQVIELILNFLSSISWPVSVFGSLFLLLHAVRNGWIGNLKAWHKDSGVEIGALSELLVANVESVTELNEDKIKDIERKFRITLDNFSSELFKIERGSNYNGIFFTLPSGARVSQTK